MPSIQEAKNANLSSYSQVQSPAGNLAAPPLDGLEPNFNPMMRCPLPLLVQMTGDTQRQFYQGSKVPQIRFLVPPTETTGGGTSSGNVEISNSGGGGGIAPAPAQLTPQTTTTTNVLSPNSIYTGAITVSESFQMLGLTCSNAARVRLYGTAIAQSGDVARGLDVPPPAGTMQNILCDVVLDTNPFQWTFQSRVGANGDTPQQAQIYVTVTNLSATTQATTVALAYIPLETAT